MPFPVSRIFIEVPNLLCIYVLMLTPVESNSDESFRLSRIKVLVPKCRKPYYLHC